MSVISQYQYPNRDILTVGFSGVSDNSTKYVNIDEGVSSPNYNDYMFKSGIRAELSVRHSLQFGLGALHVLPSSTLLNINLNTSGSNISSTGNLWLERALLLNSNSGIIAQYEYKSAGEPTYSWALSSDFSTKNVILSGFTTNSDYFNDTICDIRLSGNFTTSSEATDNFKTSISAFEFLSSGVIGVEFSGMPLFITGPRIVSECLKVIDASGYSGDIAWSGAWKNHVGAPVVNTPNWWQAVGSGVHTPNDNTYIYSIGEDYFQQPVGLSGLGSEPASWADQTPTSLIANSVVSIPAINAGVLTPITSTYFNRYPGLSTTPSPQILFNKPETGSYRFGIAFNCEKILTDDRISLRNVQLKNGNGVGLCTWPDDEVVLGTSAVRYTTQKHIAHSSWTQYNNYLTFDVYQVLGAVPSGQARFYEIDIFSFNEGRRSPDLYLTQPTLSNVNAGASLCFRITNNGGSEINLSIDNPLWSNSEETIDFEELNLTLPISGTYNYCSRSIEPIYSDLRRTSFNYVSFDSLVPSGSNIQDVLYTEIELCCSGLDPVNSGYIPLFIRAMELSSSGIPLYEGGHAPINSGMSLYEYGHDTKSSGLSLFINGVYADNSGIPLYIAGPFPSNSGLSLYTYGVATQTSGLPLYIAGPIPQSSWMPLFLKADTIPVSNGSVSLFTYSSANSGLFKNMPLYIGGSGDTNTSMPLYLMGPEHADVTSNMILFLKGIGNLDGSLTVSSGLPMFLKNGWTSQNSGVPLYIKTQEGTMGAIPISSWMPLFINREFNSTANNVPLYLKVADVGSGNIPMYVNGAYVMESGISLVIPSVYTSSNLSLPMYTHAH